MKTLDPSALPALPTEVKSLVREGVYALYTLLHATASGGRFLLVTRANEFYVLSSLGEVLGTDGARDISSFEIETPLTFSGSDSVRINQSAA